MDRKFLVIMCNLVLVLVLLTVAFLREKQDEWRDYASEPVTLTLPNGQTERCLTCHQGIEEISPAHPIETFGCVSCHGGNGLALDRERAHQGLRGGRNPSALSVAAESCGQDGCHNSGTGNLYRSPVETVPLTLMATKAGEIAEMAFTYGWQKDHLARYAVEEVTVSSGSPEELLEERGVGSPHLETFAAGNPLQEKLAQNCLAFCHLNTGFDERSSKSTHLGGCAACHTPFATGATYQGGDPTIDPSEPGHAPFHRLTAAIPYNQCNACHNQGVHSVSELEFVYRDDVPISAVTDPRADRNETYYIPQAQYTLCEIELDCIDCHTRNEVMGDGYLHGKRSSAQTIKCYNCHGTKNESPKFEVIPDQDHDAVWVSRYLGEDFPELKPGQEVALTDEMEPMVNVRRENGQVILYSKITGQRYLVPQVKNNNCEQDPGQQKGEDCHTCHDISRP